MLLKYLPLWVVPPSTYRQNPTYDFRHKIGFSARKSSLLSSGIYGEFPMKMLCQLLTTHPFCPTKGVVKVIATALFIIFGVETLGRKVSLFISAIGMGTLFFIIGAILKTHPPTVNPNLADASPPPASQAMAAMLYIYVCFYSMGWGKRNII